jgi:hypothetical protein
MKYTSSYVRKNDGNEKRQGFLRYKTPEAKWLQKSKTFDGRARTEQQAKKALSAWRPEMERGPSASRRGSQRRTPG